MAHLIADITNRYVGVWAASPVAVTLEVQVLKWLAELMGISAIKFTELSHHRTSDYVFDLAKMVSTEGDTAPYLQYSFVRCRSIFRRRAPT